jgi:hypothetical protein
VAGAEASIVSRQPYIQNVGRTHVTILWRTVDPVRMRLLYDDGAHAPHQYFEPFATREHEVTLTQLEPGTRYFYRLTLDNILVVGGPDVHFHTDPGRDAHDFSFFVTADVGEQDSTKAHQHVTEAAIRSFQPRADFGLLAGDIVYPDGAAERYDAQLMRPWSDLLVNTPVWPALGNHDWNSDPEVNFAKQWALPNNEHYYSFDYGNAHFIALDTKNGTLYQEEEQLAWLEQDLSSNFGALWTFVFFHHPFITCTYKGNLRALERQLAPLFETHGVDVVFTGHAHTYERLFPIVKGKPTNEEQDPYYSDPEGPIYIVSGCGGQYNRNDPTSYSGPTAFFLDERILFSQVIVSDVGLLIIAVDSYSGDVVDWALVTKSQPTDVRLAAPATRLHPGMPNPFNPFTTIPFEIAHPTQVRLDVYTVHGRWIRALTDRKYDAGTHRVIWNGADHAGQSVASGTYVVRLRTSAATHTIKTTLLR